MSHLSDIGFDVKTSDEFKELVEKAYKKGELKEAEKGKYSLYSDPSGAELWVQLTKKNELMGANPHYKGKSRRIVSLTAAIPGEESELDGSFHAWADPQDLKAPETGAYPFIFDVPNYDNLGKINFPKNIEIQLAAFAREFSYHSNEKAYMESQGEKTKFASQFFIPSGLFVKEDEKPQAFALFAGKIKDYEKKFNELTKQEFYWFLADTLGGEIDIVVDTKFIKEELKKGGIISGQFWLSGMIIN